MQAVQKPELVLLDVMLPGLDGINVCANIRKGPGPQPVIVMLTARRDEQDALAGFAAGADDYVRKPFYCAELTRRVDALLGLTRRSAELSPVTADTSPLTLEVDGRAQLVRVEGKEVHLTPKEFALLDYLFRRPGEVVAREALLAEIWRYHHAGYARTVDTHVMRIRKKLARGGLCKDPIATVFGVGYRYEGGAA